MDKTGWIDTLAVVPSGWLRKAWAWLQSRKADDSDQAGA